MLRIFLAGILALTATAACSKESDAPAAAIGKPAGKVIELTGKVEATREGKTRALAMGAEVFADDEVATAAEATVTIELFHNNARWAVVSNKKSRVDASLAWGLDKQAASKTVEHNSAAAGRNAERSAADTSSTAGATGGAPRAEESAAPAESAPTPAAAPQAPPPVAAAEPPTNSPPPPPPPPPPRGAPMKTEASGGKGATATASRAAESPIATLDKAADADRADEKESAPRARKMVNPLVQLLEAQRADFKKCLSPQNPQVSIKVMVKKGKATFTLGGPGNITDKVRSCIEIVMNKIKFAQLDGETTIEFE